MTQPSEQGKTRLNVAVDADLHRELRLLSVQLGEPLTQLVPRLLRQAVRQEAEKRRA